MHMLALVTQQPSALQLPILQLQRLHPARLLMMRLVWLQLLIFVLTFNETVQAGTGNITLFKSDNTQVEVFDVTTDVTVSGATVTLDPAADLDSLQGYYVQVASTAVKDTSNNAYAGISDTTTLSFTAAVMVMLQPLVIQLGLLA